MSSSTFINSDLQIYAIGQYQASKIIEVGQPGIIIYFLEICVCDLLVFQLVRQLLHSKSIPVASRLHTEGAVGITAFQKRSQNFLYAACRHQNTGLVKFISTSFNEQESNEKKPLPMNHA